ncbi:hypothetical protein A3D78_06975 [Candidatus Gottesmanbacteria bacterium RIFCSPHIGHO2_02_FULL_39_14]|uniref:DUF962 family protein n=2 Tax=Candidatus Gottesmaniibacteriota TaxID=1752720 RepID=A0A1F5ZV04_9BACT|nr:MAG: hypothetical protein A3D78_06975 [Candidatus Gottesmanbacteria bacterium RIFCSPHIGHO2_02_FULL_39_14]OGG32384.1 MAG: hypothetical protein A3I51_00885 [Candidatus Gottesmanbacteria bacterium RIFCSPLOWO2_02_FULL_38_8]
MTQYAKYAKKIRQYFSDHPDYNSAVHLIAGVGIGILLTYPLVGQHPIRWSVVLLVVALLGHLYPLAVKK